MAIRIFITGGTFDKEFEVYSKDAHLQAILNLGRSQALLEIRTLTIADSLEMTDHDRGLIAYQSNDCKENQIVITHGRD